MSDVSELWPNRFSGPRRGLFAPPVDLPADSWRPSGEAPASALPQSGSADVACSHHGCAGGWTTRWKRRSRPMFAGGWTCSRGCLEAVVAQALRREAGSSSAAGRDEPYRHRVPLGLVLLAQGLITDPQLREALEAQREAGYGRIGDWLTKTCRVPEATIVRGLGVQWGCPVLDVRRAEPATMALALPAALRSECGLLPVRSAGGRLLYVAFREAVNPAAAFALETMSGVRVESGLLSGAEFGELEERLRGCAAVPCQERTVQSQAELVAAVAEAVQRAQPVESRLVCLQGVYWLRMWLERGALPASGTLPASAEDVADHLFRLATQSIR